jgi:hypothetical protein
MKFDWQIKIGDLLTSLTVLISVTALLISWSKDRMAREAEQADKVRGAAAIALTKLDRWQHINEAFFKTSSQFMW